MQSLETSAPGRGGTQIWPGQMVGIILLLICLNYRKPFAAPRPCLLMQISFDGFPGQEK